MKRSGLDFRKIHVLTRWPVSSVPCRVVLSVPAYWLPGKTSHQY